jgi:Ca2+-binding EF-hand superfamily protein
MKEDSMNTIGTSSMMSAMMTPPTSNISRDIITQSDENGDSSLSIDELGISEDLFSSLDSDGDSLVTQNEIANAIDSKLSEFGDSIPSAQEFGSLLSDLGLQMPPPPGQQENSSNASSNFASQLMSAYDTDGDSLLSAEEVSILSENEFSALDADGDGSITEDELSSAIDEVASSSTETQMAPPPPPGGGGMSGGGSSESEDDETYSALDTNEDGVVSQEELEAAYGIQTEDENTTTTSQTSATNNDLANGVKMLLDAIKYNSEGNEENIDLSNFSNIMKMMNSQSNNSELNTYVNNLSNKPNSTFSYA